MIEGINLKEIDRDTLKRTYKKITVELTRHNYGLNELKPKEIIELEEAKKQIRDEMARKDYLKIKYRRR